MKMNSADTEDDDPLQSTQTTEEKHYFESRDALDSLFAGKTLKNLKLTEQRLSVLLTARDSWVRIAGPEQNVKRAASFLKELAKIQLASARELDQRDFEQTLSAFEEFRENDLQEYFTERIKVSPRKREIVPRTPTQLRYVKQIKEKDVVFGIGPAGTGKTYLAMAMGVSELLAGKFDRIVLTRPAVEAGENLGFLPGKLEDKINPYLRPLYDALYDMLDFSEAEALIEKNIIEVAPLAFMRGRTLNNAFIILDEAQNATNEQMLMFLTRLGFHSKCIVAGDPSQTDLPVRKASGLMTAVKNLEPLEEIAICRFSPKDVVRHSLVEKIINAYGERSREKAEKLAESGDENV